MYPSRGSFAAHRQRGYLMPVAIAIIVLLGLLAVTLSRTTQLGAVSSTQEGVALQALYAAESGAQLGMNQLFYSPASMPTRASATARCVAMNVNVNFDVPGLRNCAASVTCAPAQPAGANYYQLSSVGNCGSGAIAAQRQVRVSAVLE